MRREPFTRPIPATLRDTLSMELDQVEDTGLRYKVRRLVEVAYGEGYDDGHMNGAREQSDDDRVETGKVREKLRTSTDEASTLRQVLNDIATAVRENRALSVNEDGMILVAETAAPRP